MAALGIEGTGQWRRLRNTIAVGLSRW